MKKRIPRTITGRVIKPTVAKTAKGEVWRIATSGKVRTVTTTAKSTKAMDKAVKLYGRALERLSHR